MSYAPQETSSGVAEQEPRDDSTVRQLILVTLIVSKAKYCDYNVADGRQPERVHCRGGRLHPHRHWQSAVLRQVTHLQLRAVATDLDPTLDILLQAGALRYAGSSGPSGTSPISAIL